jgi:hypothetical protein
MFRFIMTASNVSFQVVDDSITAPAPLPTPPPTTNRPLSPSDAASGSSSSAASPGVIAGSVVGAIACKPWQPQPCTKIRSLTQTALSLPATHYLHQLPAWRLQRTCGEIGEPFFPINSCIIHSLSTRYCLYDFGICFQSRSCNL